MGQKLPFYMAYPTPFLFDGEKKEERDYEYLRAMYPELARKILPYVEEACDRLEYENSMIFDEYPDRLQLRILAGRVYRSVEDGESGIGRGVEKDGEPDAEHIREMTEVLLFQEILRRRQARRRRQPRIYTAGSTEIVFPSREG